MPARMSSLSVFGWVLLSLLTVETFAQLEVSQCTVGPTQSSHPVQGLLERFEAGPGCSARESGPKETHVIGMRRARNNPENKVTVLLTPLFPSREPLRAIHLLLSSRQPLIWCLEGHKLPAQLTVIVQVSSQSTVQSKSLNVQVQRIHSLPFRPRALHRWALRHHGNITSLTHSAHSNHVYIKVGQDQNESTTCHLQSMFLSPNYMTSDLQPQEVQGCSPINGGTIGTYGPEVHIIKLHSAGSGLCGSLQVEVEVSLIPSVKSMVHNIVLVLSSSVPVNWAIVAGGIQGHVDIYCFQPASLGPAQGYSSITSFTEADLANRFRFTSLGLGQRLSVPVAAVTLRDPTCQAQSNGSHFLLVFPVISCQTEGDLLGHSGGVQYKNTVFFWRDKPPTILDLNETELRSKGPLSIRFTCLAPSPVLTPNDDVDSGTSLPVMAPWTPQGSKSKLEERRKRPSSRLRPGPELAMRLFVSETFEEKRIGPCVITAEHRVYAEISAKGTLVDVIEVKSCIISPQSDPKKSPFWSVIRDGCTSDDSFVLGPVIKRDNGSVEDEQMKKENTFEMSRIKRNAGWTEKKSAAAEEQVLRFSFIMKALYNESMQFLHCSLLLCGSDVTGGVSRAQTQDCQTGIRIPPLVSTATTHQCEIRNLSRPMVVTRPISSLARKPRLPPAGQRFKRLSVAPLASPDPEHISSMVQIGPLLAIMFTAFVMGTCLMGGLWYIYSHTGPSPLREDGTVGGRSLLNPSSQSILSNSSV
ncbi:hypothetical protein WMY93_003540 [Mugilogobius chulae]|uniref:ZP domain-containing protein n=1 Tax=Mugilogobius chulae TaxID=88201 RepID=A0AAW0Q7T9_9GOBI